MTKIRLFLWAICKQYRKTFSYFPCIETAIIATSKAKKYPPPAPADEGHFHFDGYWCLIPAPAV
jgi:hypothetical protein